MSESLTGTVAVVTGASRGAGKGIAVELGAAGATVYVTGRSRRGRPAAGYERILASNGREAMPGSVDETADEVTAAGGRGIAVECDHTSREDVAALFRRVEEEQGGLHVLVNNAWGGHETFFAEAFGAPFWEQPLEQWEGMFDRGVRNHVLSVREGAPLLMRGGGRLVVTTTFWDRDRYLAGNLFYDVAKAAMNRVAFAVAEELRPHGIASVAVSPGWMRTELILAAYDTDESSWHDVPALVRTESPRYLGRAVAALAADRDVMARSGRVLLVGELAEEYGFTDNDGRHVPPFEMPEPTAADDGEPVGTTDADRA